MILDFLLNNLLILHKQFPEGVMQLTYSERLLFLLKNSYPLTCVGIKKVLVHNRRYCLWLKHGKESTWYKGTRGCSTYGSIKGLCHNKLWLFTCQITFIWIINKSLRLIKSFLTNRWQRTKVNIMFSSWSELLLVVPQGSVLGPLLFNIYLNDLFYLTEFTNNECNLLIMCAVYVCHYLLCLWLKFERSS